VFLVAAVSPFGLAAEDEGTGEAPTGAYAGVPFRIYQKIEKLKRESLKQSLEDLDQVELYNWPGRMSEGLIVARFPLEPHHGYDDVVCVMGNRRFLKVFAELKALPRQEAARIVGTEMAEAVKVYLDLRTRRLPKWKKELGPKSKTGGGVGFRVSNNADGSPTFQGARYSVLALALIAGNLQLHEARPQVLRVAREAVAERQMYYDAKVFRPLSGLSLLVNSLYSRQILATALLGTCPLDAKPDGILKSAKLTCKTTVMTRFDADATPLDYQCRRRTMAPDYSKGTLPIEYVEPLSDAQFDQVLSHATGSSQIESPTNPGP